ncbi:hypothetical protein GCM10010406_18170 [Streptomyces thermolineatus]|uniref:Uncharacterized protein n=1 Tax=Streptomyces thermolineatus TaxID=44033 RepID=A0ABP5YJ99_9ACTN
MRGGPSATHWAERVMTERRAAVFPNPRRPSGRHLSRGGGRPRAGPVLHADEPFPARPAAHSPAAGAAGFRLPGRESGPEALRKHSESGPYPAQERRFPLASGHRAVPNGQGRHLLPRERQVRRETS